MIFGSRRSFVSRVVVVAGMLSLAVTSAAARAQSAETEAPSDATAAPPLEATTAEAESAAILIAEGEALLEGGDSETAQAQAEWLLQRGQLAAEDHIRTQMLLANAHRALGNDVDASRAKQIATFITAHTAAAPSDAPPLRVHHVTGAGIASGLSIELLHDALGLIAGVRIDDDPEVYVLSAERPVLFIARADLSNAATTVSAVDAAGSAVARVGVPPGTGPQGPAARAETPQASPPQSAPMPAPPASAADNHTAPPVPTAPVGEPSWSDRLFAPWAVVPLLSAAFAVGGAGLFASGAMGFGAMAPDNPAASTFVPVFVGLMIAGGVAFAAALVLAVGSASYNLIVDALAEPTDAATASRKTDDAGPLIDEDAAGAE